LIDLSDARVLMKLFNSANITVINDSSLFFIFLLPSEILEKRKQNFSIVLCVVPTHYVTLAQVWIDMHLLVTSLLCWLIANDFILR